MHPFDHISSLLFNIGGIVATVEGAMALDLSKGKNALLIGTSVASLASAIADVAVGYEIEQKKKGGNNLKLLSK
jgi:hypothetical protein